MKSTENPIPLQNGGVNSQRIRLSLIAYNQEEFFEKENASLEECLEDIATPRVTWIQVYGVSSSQEVVSIAKHFKLHTLVLEDILHTTQRAKLDTYQEQVFIISRLLHYSEKKANLNDEQISFVFGPQYLISFVEKEETIFLPIIDHIRQKGHRIRSLGTDYLAYSILDVIVDSYFVVLEKVNIYLDQLEEQLNIPTSNRLIQNIQRAKHDMVILRKAMWPMRDVVNRFLHLEEKAIHPTTQIFLRDVYDHIVQIIDIIEGFRDIVAGMMDIYLSNINIRTNDIIKVLTMVSTIFVPLTFITGFYGMNFEYFPELHIHWFYPFVLFIMLTVACSMLLFFRKKKWV